jgi:hypothetical protein
MSGMACRVKACYARSSGQGILCVDIIRVPRIGEEAFDSVHIPPPFIAIGISYQHAPRFSCTMTV